MTRQPARPVRTTVAVAALAAVAIAPAAAVAKDGKRGPSAAGPSVIGLPAGFQPEGIAAAGRTFFVGSRASGAIYRGDLRTGKGRVLVPAEAGRTTFGLKVDPYRRLVAASGTPGALSFHRPGDGRLIKRYAPTGLGSTPLNDVVTTRDGAYATDPRTPRLVVVPFGRRGGLPEAAREIPLTGDLAYDADPTTFEANGIVTSPDRRSLIVVQSRTGKLFRVSPRTGRTVEIPVAGGPVENGDGLLREGRTLFAVQNRSNLVAELRLDRRGRSARVVRRVADPDFDVPTTIARGRGGLYVVNGRFTTPPTATTSYDVVRVDGRDG